MLTMKTLSRALREAVYPLGSPATIRVGPLRGCKYIVTEQSGWAPILGRWEPEAQRLYSLLISKGEVVWDLGANTGIHSLLFSRMVGAEGRVVAFEPFKVNIDQLEMTCRLNDAANVSIVDKAVSDTHDPANFFVGVHEKQGSLVGIGSESGKVIQVPCTTLDAAQEDCTRLDFIKIDVEGAELKVVSGFSRVGRFHPTFAIEVHTPELDIQVRTWLRRHGYRLFRLQDAAVPGSRANGPLVNELKDEDPADGAWGTVVAVHPSRSEKLDCVLRLAASGQ
jgi:FkbM family methyltransferase